MYEWITDALARGRGLVMARRLGGQDGDLGARLLDEVLQVDLPQLLGQLLQLLLHVLHAATPAVTTLTPQVHRYTLELEGLYGPD